MNLATYLSKTGKTQAAFANEIGVQQVTVNRYVKNERFPDPGMIARIAEATGRKVTVMDWHEQAAEHRASKQGADA